MKLDENNKASVMKVLVIHNRMVSLVKIFQVSRSLMEKKVSALKQAICHNTSYGWLIPWAGPFYLYHAILLSWVR